MTKLNNSNNSNQIITNDIEKLIKAHTNLAKKHQIYEFEMMLIIKNFFIPIKKMWILKII